MSDTVTIPVPAQPTVLFRITIEVDPGALASRQEIAKIEALQPPAPDIDTKTLARAFSEALRASAPSFAAALRAAMSGGATDDAGDRNTP